MTAPNQLAALNPAAKFGVGQTGIDNLTHMTQDNVTALLKTTFSGGSTPGWATTLENIGSQIWHAFHGLEQIIAGIGGTIATDISDTILTLVGAANSALHQLSTLILRIGGTVIEDVGDAIKGTAITLSTLSNNLLHNAAAVIGQIPQGIVSGLNSAMSALSSGIAFAKSFVQQVIDAILSGLRGIPIIGGFIPDLNKAVKQQKSDQQAFTISAIVSDYRNPSYVCRYAIADVTYEEALNNHMLAFGTTDGASTGTAHTHTIGSTNSVAAAPAGWSVNQNESRGSYMTITNTTVHDTVGCVVWKDSGTLNNVYLEIFKVNSDGSLTRVASQEFSSSITTTTTYFEFTLPSRLIVQSGEQFVLRIRNSSSVATTVRVIGMELVSSAPDVGFKTVGSTLSSQTSYTASQATTARGNGTTLNWFMLAAKNMPAVDRMYSDSFKRISIGGEWVRQSSTLSLIDVYDEALGYTGTSDGEQSALYIRRCTRDSNKVEANLYVNANSTVRSGLLLHAARDFSQVVYLGVDSVSAKIYSGPIDSLTERASLASGGTGKWGLYYDPSADKYVALFNTADIGLQWTSVGSAVTHGDDYQFGGARIECAGGEPAGTIDDWELRDWNVAVIAAVTAPRAEATVAAFDAIPAGAVTIASPTAAATAAGVLPVVAASATVTVPRAEATASAAGPGVSVNDHFPYAFPFDLT